MPSYFKQCLERHYNNYLFTSGMFPYNSRKQAQLYASALKEVDRLVDEFDAFGYKPYAELSFYSKRYKHNITKFYYSQQVYA